MKNIILYDREETRTNLLPFTYTRPVGALRVGITTLREKWEYFIPGEYSWLTDEYLSIKYPTSGSDSISLFIDGSVIATRETASMIDSLPAGKGLSFNDRRIAFCGTLDEFRNAPDSCFSEVGTEVSVIENLYDIFLKNGECIKADFEHLTAGRSSAVIPSSCTVIGNPELVFIEDGVDLEGAFLNTKSGPIYLGPNSTVMECSCLRGPFALCEHSYVNMGTKIYSDTTIGPYCKVGGELNNVVMIGYSNKAHDGFLGNAVIGEWCNLGAGCVASNLKNDYTEIKLWNYTARRFARTGLQFCGLMMGDHSKAGINTMFNTATVLGVGVNVYGSGFQRNFLASFSEGSRAGFNDVPMQKFFEIAERVMARRGVALTDVDKEIFMHINEMAHNLKF